MKPSIKSLVALLAVTAIASNVHARHGQYHKSNLININVENDIRKIGRIYVQVKSALHRTKLRAIWGIKNDHIKFAAGEVNTICAYTDKRNPTERFIYKIAIESRDRDAIDNHITLKKEKSIYTYRTNEGPDENIFNEQIAESSSIHQVLINGEWREVQE